MNRRTSIRCLGMVMVLGACGSSTTADMMNTPVPDLTMKEVPPDMTQPPDLTVVYDLTAPTCNDGIKNGSETDVDCGGNCAKCSSGKGCAIGGDCTDLVCTGAVCQAATCSDNIKNAGETDVDCGGGVCPHCGINKSCNNPSDCAAGVCITNLCVAPSCTDGVKNGGETDVDCGGPCATKCMSSQMCNGGLDCVTGVCMGGSCAQPTCTDNLKNGTETDVDCGGATCGACGDGKKCGKAADCTSSVCSSNVCVAGGCTDGVKNGTETDIDCGGTGCSKCATGKKCIGASDCVSLSCSAGVCEAATCSDTILNQTETDVDCGGTCTGCATGKKCVKGSDCLSLVCGSNGTCSPASCTDGVKNGSETDVDCGGTCGACAIGKACGADADCKPSLCISKVCKYAGSCTEILTHNPGTVTGDYSIEPNGITVPVMVHCDMSFVDSGTTGGWTQLLQCLPGDNCTVGGNTLMNVDWTNTDYGQFSSSASYLLGYSLNAVTQNATQLMFEITDTSTSHVGHIVYPLNSDTRHFFSATSFYESARLTTIITDYNGNKSQRSIRICWSTRANSPYSRTLQGDNGLFFLGQTSAGANENANSGCDYGPWQAQMLMRDPHASSMNAMWGVGPVGTWANQSYAHRVYIR